MIVKFTKMHGLGNDFMVVDLISQHAHFRPEQIRRLADRHMGIGFDQLLLVEPPGLPDADFRYRIFNADGSEVEQCGNGARCFARFVRDHRLINKRVIKVQTARGMIELTLLKDGWVKVNMGAPWLDPVDIPFVADSRSMLYDIEVEGKTWQIGAVSMGNPHAILLVDDVQTAPVETLGPLLEAHPRFPQKANIGFLQIVNRGFARIRVYERGVGETLACGTGACAAMVFGSLLGRLDPEVELKLSGGNLKISWDGEGQPVMMSGPACRVYEGQVRI